MSWVEDYNNVKKRSETPTPVGEKRVNKVISGRAKTKKRSEIKKFADIFIAEDVSEVKTYLISDVIIPLIKKTVVDVITNGINMLFYGDDRSSKKSSVSRVSYRQPYYDYGSYQTNDRRPAPQRPGYGFDDIVLDTRGEAEAVLSQMEEIVSTYGLVSVADLYEMVGLPTKHTYNKYGWTENIRDASVVRTYEGYLLKLPKACPLD